MRVTVEANLVSGITDGSHVFREGFQRVAGNEPRCLDIVLFEHGQQSLRANGGSKDTSQEFRGISNMEYQTPYLD